MSLAKQPASASSATEFPTVTVNEGKRQVSRGRWRRKQRGREPNQPTQRDTANVGTVEIDYGDCNRDGGRLTSKSENSPKPTRFHHYGFISEVELGKFLGGIDVIPDAYRAISETYSSHRFHTNPCAYNLHTNPSGLRVLAFHCSPDYTTRFRSGEFDLVSSNNREVIDFISDKLSHPFNINKAAVDLFEDLFFKLSHLKDQLIDDPLVVTGQSVAGYLAILYTLWLQHAVDVKESSGSWGSKRPICITFGSPLIGDEKLQQIVFEHPQWKYNFLNVVSNTDPVAAFFSSDSIYKPFGTFLFCTESGGHTAFEDQELVLAVLDAMASLRAIHSEMHDYGSTLRYMKRNILYRGVSDFDEFNLNSLRTGITLQLREVGMLDMHKNNSLNDLIDRMERKQAKIFRSKRNMFEPAKKLNEMEISMMYMEWYIKAKILKGGYYHCYKNIEFLPEAERIREYSSKHIIVMHQRMLSQYWNKIVAEKDRMPQKKGAKLRKRWLYAGTSYREKLEPLDIAEYYEKGNKNYIENRSNLYKLLEKWWIEDKKDLSTNGQTIENVGPTHQDSCFWAFIEEASVSLRDLEKKGPTCSAADIAQGVQGFETNVQRVLAIVRARSIVS